MMDKRTKELLSPGIAPRGYAAREQERQALKLKDQAIADALKKTPKKKVKKYGGK